MGQTMRVIRAIHPLKTTSQLNLISEINWYHFAPVLYLCKPFCQGSDDCEDCLKTNPYPVFCP